MKKVIYLQIIMLFREHKKYQLHYNDVTTTAQVVNYDENQDVAMIKITDESVEIPATVELGDSDALQPGEEVIAIGTPLSTELSSTVTKG